MKPPFYFNETQNCIVNGIDNNVVVTFPHPHFYFGVGDVLGKRKREIDGWVAILNAAYRSGYKASKEELIKSL